MAKTDRIIRAFRKFLEENDAFVKFDNQRYSGRGSFHTACSEQIKGNQKNLIDRMVSWGTTKEGHPFWNKLSTEWVELYNSTNWDKDDHSYTPVESGSFRDIDAL